MEEGIPEEIKTVTLSTYREAKTNYNRDEFVQYLESHRLFETEMNLIKVFKPQETLTIENCGW